MVVANVQWAIGAAPADYGLIIDPPPTSLWAAAVGFAVVALLVFIVPFHLGGAWASRVKDGRAISSPGARSGAGWASLVWACAVVSIVAEDGVKGHLAWLAAMLYLTAFLSLRSGWRAKFAEAPELSAYAGMVLGLGSAVLSMGLGWSWPLILGLSLWMVVVLDLAVHSDERVPAWWIRWQVAFVLVAVPASLVMSSSGPDWIG
ncbi:hypothetical protein [Sphingosinicella terrae]|uniref:hypothetical protein n=1 Tax=Sphingosinicella terrae TaxID=2172047 RepID=UPI0013B4647C|nr:hypothetical protein [Sphingosinicella terrae]